MKASFPLLRLNAALVLVCLMGFACDRTALLSGSVRDFRGHALPGVAVTVRGQDVQTMTNGRGQYLLRCRPGRITLDFHKTGYTPGRYAVGEVSHFRNEAEAITLWPLPATRGVYLLQDFRYHPADPTEPKPFTTREHGDTHGITSPVEQEAITSKPVILSHKMPPYDLRLHRLEEVMAADPDMDPPDYNRPVRIPVEAIPVAIAPIDKLEKLLIGINLQAPLDPGIYAVHWGALEGYPSTDPRAYLFRVPAPPSEEAAASQDDAATSQDDAATSQDDAATSQPDTEKPDTVQ
ncbi:MAG: carboxypeptidase-like regulatory domain-containing protein [Candidatus Hydrogenedentota bacterium]